LNFPENISTTNQTVLPSKQYRDSVDIGPLAKFRQIHIDIISGNSTKYPPKVSINGYTDGGYGNKLYSFLSSLAIALLIDSALVVRWNHIDKLIEEPLPGAFFNYSSRSDMFNIDWKTNEVMRPGDAAAWQQHKNMDSLIKTQIDTNSTARFHYNSENPLFFGLCTNPKYYDKFLGYGLVSNKTVENARKVAAGMDNYSAVAKAYTFLQVSFEVGGNLLNKLWRPNKEIREIIKRIVNEDFANNYVIGIQLRLVVDIYVLLEIINSFSP
jgi:hypothetical protein